MSIAGVVDGTLDGLASLEVLVVLLAILEWFEILLLLNVNLKLLDLLLLLNMNDGVIFMLLRNYYT